MVLFYQNNEKKIIIAVDCQRNTAQADTDKLKWLFGDAELLNNKELTGYFVGPRKEMITPWSTNAVEITQNMGIRGIVRIEEFLPVENQDAKYDPMLKQLYKNIDQTIFTIEKQPEPVIYIEDIDAYNKQEGLALSLEEVEYLNALSKNLGRKLTDSEVFGFSQVNSEHCRHKIFNGKFIIDNQEMPYSLFQLIKKTSKENPNRLVSAYKDNVAFVEGPFAEQFAPQKQDRPDFFIVTDIETVLSLKAETHNFPTTVEPFNGAATGSGGEIRDRMAGGKGSIPLAGTAVYMTSYPRLDGGRKWEKNIPERSWLYQTPEQILIKASNGASDFGNKFGQPLICGSLLTFEHFEELKKYGYDKVIMLAGGIGFAKKTDSLKDDPQANENVIILGGDNYRIGMGGGAVSSVATGEYNSMIELNAVQRSNPEMQKRAFNAIRALVESSQNPIVSIHDHGAGGHLNCLSELVETTGGVIDINKLPIGDPTLSAKEIIGNESQERMGLVLKDKDIETLQKIAERERSPMYVVGKTTGDMNFTFTKDEDKPINLNLADFFGNPPQTVLIDQTIENSYGDILFDENLLNEYVENILQIEAVACKDWLTNKVDRSVTGKVAKQQTTGELQLPLNNVGVTSIDYQGIRGIATAIGHAPVVGLINPANGSIQAIAESLTNLVWAPLDGDMESISLSANWMWPCKNEGEDARLYKAVEAAVKFAIDLGINIPTGKDSLSMKQKYPDGEVVFSPGTVIISAVGEVENVQKTVETALQPISGSQLIYIDFSNSDYCLGGSSFAQITNQLGTHTPKISETNYFKKAFLTVQKLIKNNLVLAGHDISAGGLITSLLEMAFPNRYVGLDIDLQEFNNISIVPLLFSEKSSVIIQVANSDAVKVILDENQLNYAVIGKITSDEKVSIKHLSEIYLFDIPNLRNKWVKTSYELDRKQSGDKNALERFTNYKYQRLSFQFNEEFSGKMSQYNINPKRKISIKNGLNAAIIREKGVNGDREMAYSLYLAGFNVKDVHMTDLISGRETLENINFIVFVGGFSNSDVLGSAKGWAGAFLYNPKAKEALDNFYKRPDTMSLGVCNGCQLMVELGLITPKHTEKPRMLHNDSHKFESAFLTLDIQATNSIMMKSLVGSRLGIWVAHGEGKFVLPYDKNRYDIPLKYSYEQYPGNPNGSDYATAAICSENGRHLAMMPHLERAIFSWQWANYPSSRKNSDEITPWIEAFVNAREWIHENFK